VAPAAAVALDVLSEEEKRLYWDVILNRLPAIVRQSLEAHMIKGYVYQSDFARKYYFQGRDEGRADFCLEILEAVSTRLPGLRDEIAARLRDQQPALRVQISLELSKARNEAEARAVLARLPERPCPEVIEQGDSRAPRGRESQPEEDLSRSRARGNRSRNQNQSQSRNQNRSRDRGPGRR
jgi:hypothetical protein